MTLSWDAPSSDGGAAVSGYAVYRDGSLIATVPAFPRTYDDNPLDPGTLYAYQVLALNVAGTSPFPSALVLPTLPSAPLIPTLYALPGTIEVVFDDATIEVVDYFTVFYRVADSEVTNPWLEWTPDVDDVSPTVLTGLVNGTAYDVIVAAGNASGASQSVPASATPVAPPSAPRNLVADPGTAEMELAWLSPLDDGGAPISDYEVEFSSNAGSSWSLFADGTSTATSATVTGLVAGTPYQFRTRACNATGCGVDSNIMSATTSRITPPTRTTSWEITSATLYKRNNWIWIKADTDVAHVDTAIAGLNSIDEMNESNGDAQSIWQLSVDGRPFECVQLGYNQACQAGTNQVFSGASFPLANVGLFPGSLMIWEYAGYNGMIDGVCYEYAGGSPSSSFSLQFKTPSGEYSNRFEVSCAIKTAFVPAVVGNLTTTATAGQVSLTWSAPANNGGDSISDYIVEYKSSSAVSWSLFADGTSTATTATVTGLSNGTVYVFRVAARNAIGDAAWVTSQPATPQDPISLLYPAAHFSPFSSAQTLSPTVEGSIASFSLSGDLPAGVQFDSSTGVFTGPTSWDLSAIQVSSGKSHTCAVTSVGSVKCWGDNTFGQLGDGSTTSRSVPVGVSGLTSGVLQVLASDGAGLGGRHTCALTAAGGVKCWGDNTFGQLGDGTNTNRHTPVNVLGLSTGVQQVDVGARHTCATLRTGELRCWGYNQYGSLGDGTSVDRATPVPVLNIEYVAEVSAGDAHTCARTTAGAVKCWGLNERGAVGDGSDTTRYAPVDVVGLDSGVARISLGSSYSCALTTAAAAKCWGGNASGVIGDGTTTDRYTPVNVLGLSSGVARIDAGFEHTCAVSSAGALKCWGWGDSGRLGNGSTNAVAVLEPFKVPALQSGVLQVSSGAAHTCVMLHHGSIKCFGANWTSQLGDGTSTTRTTPIQVSNFSGTTTWPATVSVTVTSTTGSTDSTNLTLYALQVGSTGPGGGTIFYTTPTSFTCGVSLNEGCTYLEAAPGTAAFFARWCATGYAYPGLNGTAVGSTDSAIGTGRLNTAVAAGTCTGGVVEYADSYVNNAHIDWFLPSADELEQMRILHLLDLDVQDAWYWSSTELVSVPFHGRVAYQTYLPYGSQYTEGFKVNGNLALPIRAGK
jgi:alpha-tubulin suppressor-like RCC1 family protein